MWNIMEMNIPVIADNWGADAIWTDDKVTTSIGGADAIWPDDEVVTSIEFTRGEEGFIAMISDGVVSVTTTEVPAALTMVDVTAAEVIQEVVGISGGSGSIP